MSTNGRLHNEAIKFANRNTAFYADGMVEHDAAVGELHEPFDLDYPERASRYDIYHEIRQR